MGNLITKSAIENIKLINFDYLYNNLNNEIVLINTLSEYEQECLIINTLSIKHEIEVINNLLSKDKNKEIIIYGKNCSDHTVFKKYLQLNNLGFKKWLDNPSFLNNFNSVKCPNAPNSSLVVLLL